MAKRSPIKAILTKQTSAYKRVHRLPHSIHGIDGSSKREVSNVPRIKALRSWTIARNFVSQDTIDAQAEKLMNPHGWSSKKNPICSTCFIQKSNNGSCGCSE